MVRDVESYVFCDTEPPVCSLDTVSDLPVTPGHLGSPVRGLMFLSGVTGPRGCRRLVIVSGRNPSRERVLPPLPHGTLVGQEAEEGRGKRRRETRRKAST